MALCPNCKMDVRRDNILKETLDMGVLRPVTTMFSCPNCHIILGIGQYYYPYAVDRP